MVRLVSVMPWSPSSLCFLREMPLARSGFIPNNAVRTVLNIVRTLIPLAPFFKALIGATEDLPAAYASNTGLSSMTASGSFGSRRINRSGISVRLGAGGADSEDEFAAATQLDERLRMLFETLRKVCARKAHDAPCTQFHDCDHMVCFPLTVGLNCAACAYCR